MAFKCKHCSAPVWPLVDDADFVRDHCEEIVRLSAELETAKRGWSDASHQMTADGLEIQTLRTALETAELRIAATEASNREYTRRFHGLTEALGTAERERGALRNWGAQGEIERLHRERERARDCAEAQRDHLGDRLAFPWDHRKGTCTAHGGTDRHCPYCECVRLRAALEAAERRLRAADDQADRVRQSYRDDPGPECCAGSVTILADMLDDATERDHRKGADDGE